MGMRITVDKAKQLKDGVLSAPIERSHLRMFGKAQSQERGPNILFLRTAPHFDLKTEAVTFDADSAIFVNEGGGKETLIVSGYGAGLDDLRKVSGESYSIKTGDKAYIKELDSLPKEIQELGTLLLEKVRKFYNGYLEVAQSGKYVERPLNFWTIKVQPRDQSLAITVYGHPEQFQLLKGGLEVNPDMSSYSRFKITRIKDLDPAVKIIRHAYEMKHAS